MEILKTLSLELNLPTRQISAAVELLDDGNTIPFIARYRKETTSGLDEEELRQINERLIQLRALAARRETILNTIQKQGLLTPELQKRLHRAKTRTELEDLYQPFRPRRKTRASAAREKGLEPLARLILAQKTVQLTRDGAAEAYLKENVPTSNEAWQGARDIAAEVISDDPDVRSALRKTTWEESCLVSREKKSAHDPRKTYQDYYNFKIPVKQLRPHQALALNRGEKEGILSISLSFPEEKWRKDVLAKYPRRVSGFLGEELLQAIEDGGQRLLLPAIERDVRKSLTTRAEEHAIEIFAKNLRALLLDPPLLNHTILALDPGFRTGCKAAVVDPTGAPLEVCTIYPTEPHLRLEEAGRILTSLISNHKVTLAAIGNGTASRETELFLADFFQENRLDIPYLIVNEAGASVYSASPLAREELPDMDVSYRGAVSIARRVLDPLSELVKIDPRSLGVGLYQHDVNQSALAARLDQVVESVVNQVGVEINTASPALLAHVSGIGEVLAEKITAHRDEYGPFSSREALLDVPGLGPKTFQQAAGFIRISGAENPLDVTAIHPESYPAAEKILARAGVGAADAIQKKKDALVKLSQKVTAVDLAAEIKTGLPTLVDIFKQLVQPGRDPRSDLPGPILRKDIIKSEDLQPDMILPGIIRNVVDFGAFIDIGVKNDGLLHRSRIPSGVELQAGDRIEVKILKVDLERGRISLDWS